MTTMQKRFHTLESKFLGSQRLSRATITIKEAISGECCTRQPEERHINYSLFEGTQDAPRYTAYPKLQEYYSSYHSHRINLYKDQVSCRPTGHSWQQIRFCMARVEYSQFWQCIRGAAYLLQIAPYGAVYAYAE